jgi:hypothetical protein
MPQRGSIMATMPRDGGAAASRFPTRRAGERHDEWLIDEAIMETFPASDPPAPYQPAHRTPHASHASMLRRAAPRAGDLLPWVIAGGAILCLGWLLGRRR